MNERKHRNEQKRTKPRKRERKHETTTENTNETTTETTKPQPKPNPYKVRARIIVMLLRRRAACSPGGNGVCWEWWWWWKATCFSTCNVHALSTSLFERCPRPTVKNRFKDAMRTHSSRSTMRWARSTTELRPHHSARSQTTTGYTSREGSIAGTVQLAAVSTTASVTVSPVSFRRCTDTFSKISKHTGAAQNRCFDAPPRLTQSDNDPTIPPAA